MTIRIGWLADDPGYQGGAELVTARLRKAVPADIEIVDCTPGDIAEDVDGYFIHNCVQYSRDIIPTIGRKTIIKTVWDVWRDGDPGLRRWLGKNTQTFILTTPETVSQSKTPINPGARLDYLPSPVDIEGCRLAARYSSINRAGVCWIGRMEQGKGIEAALEWSNRNNIPVDFYGYGRLAGLLGTAYRGALKPEEVPIVMACYKTFLFLPEVFEPGPGTLLEAYAAGCEIITNSNAGALYWLEQHPAALNNIESEYWRIVREAVSNGR